MSKFIKSLFKTGKSSSGSKTASSNPDQTIGQLNSDLSNTNDSLNRSIVANISNFSDDGFGRELDSLWKAHNTESTDQTQKDIIIQSMIAKICDRYSVRQHKENEDSRRVFQFSSSPEIFGFPTEFLLRFVKYFETAVRDDTGGIQEYFTTRLNSRSNSLDTNHATSPTSLQEFDLKRKNLLQCFRAAAILMLWPNNNGCLTLNIGSEFQCFIISLANNYSVHLQLQSNNWNKSNEGKINREHLDMVTFVLHIHLCIIQIFNNSLSVRGLNFDDNLPRQPWSFGEIDFFSIANSGQAFRHNDSHGFVVELQTTQQQNNLKNEFFAAFAREGCYTYLLTLAKYINRMINDFIIPIQDQIHHPEISRFAALLLMVQAEALCCFIVCMTSAAATLPNDLNSLIPFAEYLSTVSCIRCKNNSIIDSLIIRIFMLILRVNSIFASATPDFGTNIPLQPKHISSIFLWLHRQFDLVNDESTTQTMCESLNFEIDCKRVVGKAVSFHDLWPWKDSAFSKDSNLGSTEVSSGSFHVLNKSIAAILVEALQKQHHYALWDSIIAEVLGSQLLLNSRPQSTGINIKINAKRIRYIFQAFYEMLRDSSFIQNTSEMAFQDDSYLPLGQIKFVNFISQVFKAAEASEIFAILGEYETFRLLLGEKFLLGRSSLPNNLEDYFLRVANDDNESNQSSFICFGLKQSKYLNQFVWFLLHDRIMDYFHGLVIYSLYFQNSSDSTVLTYLGYEDIMLVLTQYSLSATKMTSTAGAYIVYRIGKLVTNLYEIVCSMAVNGSKSSRDKIIIQLLETLESLLLIRVNSISVLPSSPTATYEMSILRAAINCTAELLLHIMSPSGTATYDWIDLFLVDEKFMQIDISAELQLRKPIPKKSGSKPRTSVRGVSDRSISSVPVDVKDRTCRIRSTIYPLLLLLLEEHLYLCSLQIIQYIILGSGEAILALDLEDIKIGEGTNRKRKQGYRVLGAEVVNLIFGYLSVSHKHPNLILSRSILSSGLSSLLYVLRDENLVHLRIHIQEFIRRENLLYEFLKAFARSLYGFDSRPKISTEGSGLMRAFASSPDLLEGSDSENCTAQVEILRLGLAFLTSSVAGNDASKNELRLLLQTSKEKLVLGRVRFATVISDGKEKNAQPLVNKAASKLTSLILCAERSPTVDTIVVLLDLILEGPFAGKEFISAENTVDSLFQTDADRPKIRNTSVLQDYFQLIPSCSPDVQQFAIRSFINLIRGRASLINQNVCSAARPKVIDIALDMMEVVSESIQSIAAELIELLGRHSVSVASLKHLFRKLQTDAGGRPVYAWKIIQALQGMFHQDPGPKHTFVFDGFSSGLRLPTIYKWPAMKGFSFCCWVRVESPRNNLISESATSSSSVLHSAKPRNYFPYVLCLRDRQNVGLELFFTPSQEENKYRIVLRFLSETGESASISPDAPKLRISEGQWYFLAIALTPNSFYAKGEALLKLNGYSHKSEFSFTKLPDKIPEPTIGDTAAEFHKGYVNNTLRGQMGAMYFFSEALVEKQFADINSLGPDYVYNFEPFSADYKDLNSGAHKFNSFNTMKEAPPTYAILENGVLTSKILLAYNPVVLRGRYFLDNTPERNELKWRVPNHLELSEEIKAESTKYCNMHAIKLPGTYRSTTQDVRLAINSLGGIRAIIPLFAQIDQQLTPLNINSSPASPGKTGISTAPTLPVTEYDPNFFPAVLGLFTTMFEENPENITIFSKCGGFTAIRSLLDKASHANFNLITFNQLIGLYSRLGIELSLQESCIENIICNFKLWCNSATEVQLALFDWLIETFDTNYKKFPSLFCTQSFLDAFYQYYDYSTANLNLMNNPAFSSSLRQSYSLGTIHDPGVFTNYELGPNDNPLISNSPKTSTLVNMIAQSASHLLFDDLKLIRGKIYSLIKMSILLKPSKEFEDILAVLKYLSTSTHSTAQQEILLLISGLLQSAPTWKRQNILIGLFWGNVFTIFEYLYSTADESLKVTILWTLSNTLHYAHVEKPFIIQLSAEINQKMAILPQNNPNSSKSNAIGGGSDDPSANATTIPAINVAVGPQGNNSGGSSISTSLPSVSPRLDGPTGPASIQSIIDFQPSLIQETDFANSTGVFYGMPNLIALVLSSGDELNKRHSPCFIFSVMFSILLGKLPAELRDIVNQKMLKNALPQQNNEDNFTYFVFLENQSNKKLVFATLNELAYPGLYFCSLSQILTFATVDDASAVTILDDFFAVIQSPVICDQLFSITPNWVEIMAKALNTQFNHYLSLISLARTMNPSSQTQTLYVTRGLAALKLLRISCYMTSVGMKVGKIVPSKPRGTPAVNFQDVKTAEQKNMKIIAPKSQHELYASILREEKGFGATVVKEFIHALNYHVTDISLKLYMITDILMISLITMKEMAQSFYSSEFKEEDLHNFTIVKMKNIWILGITVMELLEKYPQIINPPPFPPSSSSPSANSPPKQTVTGGERSPIELWSQQYPKIYEEFPFWLKRLHHFCLIPSMQYFALNEAMVYILKNYFDFFYSNIDYDNHFSNYRPSSFNLSNYELQLRAEPCFEEIFVKIDYSRLVYAESNSEFTIGNNVWLSIRLLMKFIIFCHELFSQSLANVAPSANKLKSYASDNSQFLIALFLLIHQLLKKMISKNARLHVFESMRLVSIVSNCLVNSVEVKQVELLSIMLGEYLRSTYKEFNAFLKTTSGMLSAQENSSSAFLLDASILSKENLDSRLDLMSKILSGLMTSSQIDGFLRYQRSDTHQSSFNNSIVVKSSSSDNLETEALSQNDKSKITSVPTTDSVLAILEKNGISFPSDKSNVEKQRLWSLVVEYVIDFGNFMEEEILMVRMVDYGLKDQLLMMEGMIALSSSPSARVFPAHSVQKSSSSGDFTSFTVGITLPAPCSVNYDLIAFISISESRRLSEIVKQIDYNYRRSEKRWIRIFSQLANERGPWGYAAESRRREVYWALDAVETNLRLRLRLRRNPFGSRHALATLKCEGKESFVEESTILSGMSNTTNNSSNSNSNSNNNSNNDRNIYADLKKYKKIKSDNLLMDDQGDDEKETATNTELGNNSDNEDDNNEENTNNTENIFDTETISVVAEVITSATNPSGGKTIGKFECTKTRLSFNRQNENKDFDFTNKTGNNEFLWAVECFPSSSWGGNEVCGVYRRYYQLRYVALEIFFINRTSIFFNFVEKITAKRVYRFLTTRMKAPNLNSLYVGRPIQAIHRIDPELGTTITQAWVNRRLTNFEYLLLLNFIAGRTFNDLAQYPVFPWVLKDYTSNKLDLKDPTVFRNFEFPIGAQVESQRTLMQEKYESCLQLQDDGIFPYHTGSHYSTSAMVIWYLLRMEPFTSYHVWLQDGKFDRADRLFYSIQHTYRGCISNTQDVKELIPEFFCNPEFLYNTNNCQFGFRQTSEEIGDVVLPNWCRDASEFIRLHREALESEYVSQNLHHWIDLVFGCRQRPPFLPNGSDKAVESCNVFVHLSYLDAVDLESMKASDPVLYSRTLRQIDCYGQTPIQLFTKEHPRRKALDEVPDLIWPIASIVPGADTSPRSATTESSPSKYTEDNLVDKPAKVLCYGEFKISNAPIVFLGELLTAEKLVTIDTSRILGYHTLQRRQPDNVPPFTMKLDRVALGQSTGQQTKPSSKNTLTSYLTYSVANREKVIGIPFAAAVVLSSAIVDRPATLDNEIESLIGTRNNKVRYHEEEFKLRNMKRSNNEPNVRTNRTPVKMMSLPSMPGFADADDSNAKLDQSPQPMFSLVQQHRSMIFQSATMPSISNLSILQPSDITSADSISAASTPLFTPNPSTNTLNPANIAQTPANPVLPRKERVDEHIGPHLFCMLTCNVMISTIPSVTKTFQYIFSCGHWDNTFKITLADTGRLVQSLSYHREVVTCITTISDFNKHWVIVGSKDCTITVWELFPDREGEPVNASPILTLYGHDDAINCIAANPELDIIASGSEDGTIIIHTLRDGIYLRSITFGKLSTNQLKNTMNTEATTPNPSNFSPQQLDKDNYRVHMLTISKEGHVIAYSHDGYMLAVYSLNGRYLRMISVREKLHAICLSEDGRVILTGGERGLIILRWVHNLMIANSGPRKGLDSIIDGSNESDFGPFPTAIRSMILTAQEQHLIVGLESGEIRVLAQDSEYLRRKLHRRLMEIGILSN